MEIDSITDRTACNISNRYVHWLDIICLGDSASWLYTNLLDGRCEEQASQTESGIWWLHTVMGRDFARRICFTKYIIISRSPTRILKIRLRDALLVPFLNRSTLKLYIFLVILHEICVPKKHLFFHKKSMWVGTFLTVFHKIGNFSLPNANIKKWATRCSAHYFSEFIDIKLMH